MRALHNGSIRSPVVFECIKTQILTSRLLENKLEQRLKAVEFPGCPGDVLFPVVNNRGGALIHLKGPECKITGSIREFKPVIRSYQHQIRRITKLVLDTLESLYCADTILQIPQVLDSTTDFQMFLPVMSTQEEWVISPEELDSSQLAFAINIAANLLNIPVQKVIATGKVNSDGKIEKISGFPRKWELIRNEFPDANWIFAPDVNRRDDENLEINWVSHIRDVFRELFPTEKVKTQMGMQLNWQRCLELQTAFYKNRDLMKSDKLADCMSHSPVQIAHPDDKVECWQYHFSRGKQLHHAWRLKAGADSYDAAFKIYDELELEGKISEELITDAQIQYAGCLAHLYQPKKAAAILDRVQFCNKTSTAKGLNLLLAAECRMIFGQWDQAGRLLQEAQILNPRQHSPRLYTYLTRYYLTLGNLDQGEQSIKEGLKVNQNGYSKSVLKHVNDLYLRTFEVKLMYLQHRYEAAFHLANQLEEENLNEMNSAWPGPIWRQYGGIAAMKAGQSLIAEALLGSALPEIESDQYTIAILNTLPRLAWSAWMVETEDPRAKTVLPAALEPFEAPKDIGYFEPEIEILRRYVSDGIPESSKPTSESCKAALKALIRKIYP